MRTSTLRWEEILDRTIFQEPDEESASRKSRQFIVSNAAERCSKIRTKNWSSDCQHGVINDFE